MGIVLTFLGKSLDLLHHHAEAQMTHLTVLGKPFVRGSKRPKSFAGPPAPSTRAIWLLLC